MSWSFYQLRLFLEYKGLQSGVEVVAVSPRYRSQTCHQCLHIHPELGKSYRSGKSFKCGHCNWKGDADENGSKVIKLVGAAFVNPLGGSILSCNLPDYIRATESPRYTHERLALGSLLHRYSCPLSSVVLPDRLDSKYQVCSLSRQEFAQHAQN